MSGARRADMGASAVSPLNEGALAAAVRAGQATLGTFGGTAAPMVAEVCAAAGFDWILLDLEHGAGGEEQVRDVVPDGQWQTVDAVPGATFGHTPRADLVNAGV